VGCSHHLHKSGKIVKSTFLFNNKPETKIYRCKIINHLSDEIGGKNGEKAICGRAIVR
jgi:hypothetical protein